MIPKRIGRGKNTTEKGVGVCLADVSDGIIIETTISIGSARILAISLRRVSDFKSFLTMAASVEFKSNLFRNPNFGAYSLVDSLTETGTGIQ